MKILINTLFTILLINILPITTYTQAPQKIDFQAIARDTEGIPIASQDIGVKISIEKDSIGGTVVYEQADTLTTDISGLFTLKIGDGNGITGDFSEIDWGGSSYYTQVSVDKDNGTNYIDMGTMEMVSVPYALYARNTDSWKIDEDTTTTYKFLTIGTDLVAIYGTTNQLKTKMTISGNNAAPLILKRTNSAALNSSLGCQNDSATVFYGINDEGNACIGNNANQTSAPFQITQPGNVGIGTSNPQRNLHIHSVMRLEPRSSAPSDASEGDLYVNQNGHIYCYLNGVWKQLD